jgi:hypothetical protein
MVRRCGCAHGPASLDKPLRGVPPLQWAPCIIRLCFSIFIDSGTASDESLGLRPMMSGFCAEGASLAAISPRLPGVIYRDESDTL